MRTKKLPWIKEEPGIPEYAYKQESLDPFQYVKSLQGVIPPLDFSREEVEKKYNPFMMNRIVSMNPDLVLFVNEMNACKDVPHKSQYDYYDSLQVIKSRYFKYLKKQNTEEDNQKEFVSQYYESGTKDINLAMKLLSKEQVSRIEKVFDLPKIRR